LEVSSFHVTLNCADLECTSTENRLDDDDRKFLNDYTKSIGGPGLAGLRNPLHLALAISPLFLLLPQSLSKKHVNRRTLIQVCVNNTTFQMRFTSFWLDQISIALGNGKPQLLLDMEKRVWHLLFQMVEGRDLDGLLQELVECIPWNELRGAPEGDRQWFALSTMSSQMATSSKNPVQTTNQFLPTAGSQARVGQSANTHPDGTAQTNEDLSPNSMDIGADGGAQTNKDSSPNSMDIGADGGAQTNEDSSPNSMDTHADGGAQTNLDSRFNTMDTRPDGMVPRTRSQSRTSLKGTTTSPQRSGLKKRHRHLGRKKYMASPELSGETDLGHVLAAGGSKSMPIDVEALDMLMRNFPITEEHQVRYG
jgi:hypothetical protein